MVMPVHQTLPRALRRPVNMEKEPKMEWEGLKERPQARRSWAQWHLGCSESGDSELRCQWNAAAGEAGSLVRPFSGFPKHSSGAASI